MHDIHYITVTYVTVTGHTIIEKDVKGFRINNII